MPPVGSIRDDRRLCLFRHQAREECWAAAATHMPVTLVLNFFLVAA